jgi:hypothetical protein
MANTMVKETKTLVVIPNTMVKETKSLVVTPNTMVKETNTMVKIDRRYKLNIFNNLISVSDHGI